MKKIILIRHAKSSWDNPWADDYERPLAERGLRDAPKMGKRLKKRQVSPDLILSSSALRAIQTAEIIANELGYPSHKIIKEKNLYHASPNTILKYIHQQKDSIKTIVLVGHNPGLNDLIAYLGGNLENLPTAGQYAFKLKEDSWRRLSPSTVDFWFLDYPKLKP
ncbi:histidine phosphatase family protein [Algoriphagus sp. CAU 1675]|uniref:SixA phosphatase family protein n=1 Tax=Algoriphagus sp. CAU 1675 TaxID=3032597 RepID=UPI0023D99525|nr:histidine phosphatase family protein [Algoriphagus sp. CAU 1675]MDF2159248.1 histidine phosphatase family protein [Algoriphagus sp. CAU 1675]